MQMRTQKQYNTIQIQIQIQYNTNTNFWKDKYILVQVLENRAMQDEERMAKLEEELKEVYLFGIAITRQTR